MFDFGISKSRVKRSKVDKFLLIYLSMDRVFSIARLVLEEEIETVAPVDGGS